MYKIKLAIKKEKAYFAALSAILVLGAVLRLWKLDQIPSGLYWDEMDISYQAYSILHSGRDYFGNFLPLNVRSFADHHTPLYVYSSIPFIYLFGLTTIAARLPAVFFGLITIIVTYFTAAQFFKNKWLGLLSAFFIATMPWHAHYSRINFEVIAVLPFFLIGIYGLLKIEDNPKWLTVAIIGFSLSAYSYGIARIYIPLFLLASFFIFRDLLAKIPKKTLISNLALLFLLWIPILISTLGSSDLRFRDVSVFNNPNISDQVNYSREQSAVGYMDENAVGKPTRFADKVAYNKLTLPLDQIVANYINAFSTDFLFISGDPNPRHSPGAGNFGLLCPISVLLIFFGIIGATLAYKKQRENIILITAGILLALIPSSITADGAMHANRHFFMIPFLILLMAYGVKFLLADIRSYTKYLILTFIIFFFAYGSVSYWNYYFGTYRLESARHFNYGFGRAVEIADTEGKNYDLVVIDMHKESALMAYLFYTNYDPKNFQALHPIPNTHLTENIHGVKLENVLVLPPGERSWKDLSPDDLRSTGKIMLIISQSQMPDAGRDILAGYAGFNYLDTIYYPDNTPAFYILNR